MAYERYEKRSGRSYDDRAEREDRRDYGKKTGYSKGGSSSESKYGRNGNRKFDRSEGEKTYGDKNERSGNRKFDRSKGENTYGGKYERNTGRKGDKRFDPKSEQEKRYDRTQETVQNETDEQPYLLIGRNAVREAVKAGRSIDRILVTSEQDGSLREIVGLARDNKLVIREVDRKKLDELCMPFGHGGKTANHQGIVAYAAGVTYCTVQDILAVAKERNEAPFVIVLDGVEDPHNLGSIIRSADCAGAHGVIIGKRRSASVTAAAVKSSAGATEYVKVARVVNINGALQELKRAGLWIAGADMNGRSMREQGLNGALALVIGSEGDGLSKLVRENCDFLVSIPMNGHIDSLNAGVAAAVLMFEKRRQDAECAQ